jgi:hypothetical protein
MRIAGHSVGTETLRLGWTIGERKRERKRKSDGSKEMSRLRKIMEAVGGQQVMSCCLEGGGRGSLE